MKYVESEGDVISLFRHCRTSLGVLKQTYAKVTSQLVLNIQLAYAFVTTSYGSVLVS